MAKGARKKTKWVSLPLASASSSVSSIEKTAVGQQSTKQTLNAEDLEGNAYHDNSTLSNHQQQKHQIIDNLAPNSRNRSYNRHHHKGYHNQNNHYYNGGSNRSHYNSRNDSFNEKLNSQSSTDAKNNRSSSVNINEDEYTKISTPRQDVLFKKGYLSKPKTSATAETSASSMHGSDVATGSGTVSTTESVTSDGTYYTDGQLPAYSPSYPYFGYYDKNGILVMSGFAVDNNGNSYPNGGQTYIYPPNYHCQSIFDGTLEHDQMHPTYVETTELCDGSTGKTTLESSSGEAIDDMEETTIQTQNDENYHFNFDQQSLQPIPSFYDYAQFYSAFYYPGCIMTPLPVFEDTFYDESEDTSFNVIENNVLDNQDATDDHWEQYIEQNNNDALEIPVPVHQIENLETSTQLNNNDLRSQTVTPPAALNSSKSSPSQTKSLETASKLSKQPVVVSKRSQSEKHQSQVSSKVVHKKKELIESTLAFAAQNINLIKHVGPSDNSRQLSWKVVRKGKEVCLDDDPEPIALEHRIESTSRAEGPCNTILCTKTMSDALSHTVTSIKKDSIERKTKKTAKGKTKKNKKSIKDQQLQGFEVTEPDFTKVVLSRTESSQKTIDDGLNSPAIEMSDEEMDSCNDSKDHNISVVEPCSFYGSETQTNDTISRHEHDVPTKDENVISVPSKLELIEREVTDTTIPSPMGIVSILSSDKNLANTAECSPIASDHNNSDQSSGEEFSENIDSGVQSPTTFCPLGAEEKGRKSSTCSYAHNDGHVTDAVTKWLSDSLISKRVEELFVLPQDPDLLKRIYLFNFMNTDDALGIFSECNSSGTFSSDEADDVDSDYMSDVQMRNQMLESNQKTESNIYPLQKQTANVDRNDHCNSKQKRCIIM